MAEYMRVDDPEVYRRLCALHIEVSDMARRWPTHERFELASQIRRSSNSAPANLAEKNNDRHARNRIEGVNRARGEAYETIHHLFIAKLNGYTGEGEYRAVRQRYEECIRMLNGLVRRFEKALPESQRHSSEQPEPYSPEDEPQTLNSEL